MKQLWSRFQYHQKIQTLIKCSPYRDCNHDLPVHEKIITWNNFIFNVISLNRHLKLLHSSYSISLNNTLTIISICNVNKTWNAQFILKTSISNWKCWSASACSETTKKELKPLPDLSLKIFVKAFTTLVWCVVGKPLIESNKMNTLVFSNLLLHLVEHFWRHIDLTRQTDLRRQTYGNLLQSSYSALLQKNMKIWQPY